MLCLTNIHPLTNTHIHPQVNKKGVGVGFAPIKRELDMEQCLSRNPLYKEPGYYEVRLNAVIYS
jgi:hypothetical protein